MREEGITRYAATTALCLLMLQALCIDVSCAPEPSALYGNSFALLIGVNEYPHLPEQAQLRWTVNDVQALRKALVESYGFSPENVNVLTDKLATKQAIVKALSNLADRRRVGRDDRVLIYFSGHGQTVKTEDGEMGFLLPYDADVDLRDISNPGPYLETALGMQSIWDYVGASAAKHVLILADACYGGLLARSRGIEDIGTESVKVLAKKRARQVITGGDKGQQTFERAEWGHGAFTYKLLEELNARTAETGKPFTTSDLYASLLRSVGNATQGKQTPQVYSKDTDGQFLFVPMAASVSSPAITVQTETSALPEVTGPTKAGVSTNPRDGAEMVWIPEGEFLMGSNTGRPNEKPQRKVYLDGYWIYKFEVTVAQYRKFCIDTGRSMPEAPKWGWNDTHPIVNVVWQDAADYAKWAGGSLPTEAQWEKAARGTDGRTYPWGDEWDASRCNQSATGPGRTQPVGRCIEGASPYGCMDMAGNVWEWCSDWYSADYYQTAPCSNPTGAASGDRRVLRGGGCGNTGVNYARCANRFDIKPGSSGSYSGFRLVR